MDEKVTSNIFLRENKHSTSKTRKHEGGVIILSYYILPTANKKNPPAFLDALDKASVFQQPNQLTKEHITNRAEPL